MPKIAHALCAAALALLLAGCGQPIPPERTAYVGEWRAAAMRLHISQAGRVSYQRQDGASKTSIDAPLKAFVGHDFTVGIGPLTTTFVVSVPPHQKDGQWKMTVDGIELTRMPGGSVPDAEGDRGEGTRT